VSPVRPVRPGLSLIELLIVIAILAILVGIMLPAIQKVRESANRTRCQNNLKQIALGFYSHHDAIGFFPDGGKNAFDPPMSGWDTSAPSGRPEWSWTYQILPYIGEEALFRCSSDATVFRTPVPVYYCPSRRPVQLYNNEAKVDYAGSAGTARDGTNGVLVRKGMPRVKTADVSDGLASTVMLGEKRMKLDRLGSSYDDNEPYVSPGWDTEIYRRAVADDDRPAADRGPSPDILRTDPGFCFDLDADLAQFGASHPLACNIVMADGSVRTIRYNPAPELFRLLCVRNDGQPVNPGDL
jgi:prepilin-type N-terminal cleavage/methylation domain-containing protein/prepilin-type processing-associated H-X9-DG protein